MNKNGRSKACPCGHFQTNRTLTTFLNKIDSETANFQKIIDIKREENERKLNQMSFEKFIDQCIGGSHIRVKHLVSSWHTLD